MTNPDHDTQSENYERVAVLQESTFAEDWNEEDIVHLAKFLDDHDLGQLNRILHPESDMYALYVPVDTDTDDEESEESTSPFDMERIPSRNVDIDIPGPVQAGASGGSSVGRATRGDNDE